MIIDFNGCQCPPAIALAAIVAEDDATRPPNWPRWTISIRLENSPSEIWKDTVTGQLAYADDEILTLVDCDLPGYEPLAKIWDTDGSLTVDLIDICKIIF